MESQIASWTVQRDDLTARIQEMLEEAEFHRKGINEQEEQQLISRGKALLEQMSGCVSNPGKCALLDSKGELDR